jgi:hypothetical protein
MATKIKGDLQRWPGGAVRISMSAKVANDLDTFKQGVVAFAERLGCPECFSGFDCTFESERDFVIDDDLNVTATTVRAGQAVSRGATEREVSIALTPSTEFDLDAILQKIDLWGTRLGGHWLQGGLAMCCSGFDMRFERELRATVDAGGNIA